MFLLEGGHLAALLSAVGTSGRRHSVARGPVPSAAPIGSSSAAVFRSQLPGKGLARGQRFCLQDASQRPVLTAGLQQRSLERVGELLLLPGAWAGLCGTWPGRAGSGEPFWPAVRGPGKSYEVPGSWSYAARS